MAGRDEGTGALIEPRNDSKHMSWPCRHDHTPLTVVHPMVGETEQASHTGISDTPDANLADARNLSQTQLNKACGVPKTLPNGMTIRPCSEPRPPCDQS